MTKGVAVSESLSSVSDTIFNLDIIHRTDMQGNISAQQAEENLQLYAGVFSHAREGIVRQYVALFSDITVRKQVED